MTSRRRDLCLAAALWCALPAAAGRAADELPIIDAHSQFDEDVSVGRILEQAAKAGVTQILLSARGRVTPAQVLDLAAKHPACIVPAVRTKGRPFDENRPEYYKLMEEQLSAPAFRAMSEIILVHAAKGKRAPEVNVPAASPQAQEAIRRAMAKGWPIVLHYELRWLAGTSSGLFAKRMAEIEALLDQHPLQPFALIHLAQLDAATAERLLAGHANLVLLTSHANKIVTGGSRQPWTDMVIGSELAPEWKALVLRYPDRFILAFDNVWPEHWSDRYAKQTALWRTALGKLPAEIAHAVAHGNAERLWHLPAARTGEGCGALAGRAAP